MFEAELACHVGAALGEGPAWDARENALWFVDIKAQRIHLYRPGTTELATWDAPAQVGWALPAQGGGLLAGLQGGIHHFDPASGAFMGVAPVESHRPDNRLNDATVAPDGTIWFGSMDSAETLPTGQVHRFDGRTVATTPIAPVPITNGPAISPDGRTLYHVDTLGGVIHAMDLEENGELGVARVFTRIDPRDGFPDGPTVDSAGRLWLGVWGGGHVRCYDPDGTLVGTVSIPAPNVTKVALGGPDLRTAYVTTARIGLDPAELRARPRSGDLFAFETDVPGQALPLARLAPTTAYAPGGSR